MILRTSLVRSPMGVLVPTIRPLPEDSSSSCSVRFTYQLFRSRADDVDEFPVSPLFETTVDATVVLTIVFLLIVRKAVPVLRLDVRRGLDHRSIQL